VVARGRRVAQMACRRLEPPPIFDVIRSRLQLERIAVDQLHYGPLVIDRFFLLRMRLDVRLDLVARDAPRVEIAPGRHRLSADERLVLFALIVSVAVDAKVTPKSRRVLILRLGE